MTLCVMTLRNFPIFFGTKPEFRKSNRSTLNIALAQLAKMTLCVMTLRNFPTFFGTKPEFRSSNSSTLNIALAQLAKMTLCVMTLRNFPTFFGIKPEFRSSNRSMPSKCPSGPEVCDHSRAQTADFPGQMLKLVPRT